MILVKKILSVHQYDCTTDKWGYRETRNFHFISLIQKGSALHKFKDRDLLASAGEMIFLNGGESYHVRSNSSTSSYVIAFEADNAPASFVINQLDTTKIKNIWEHVMRHRNLNFAEDVYYCMSKLYELLSYIQHIQHFGVLKTQPLKERLTNAQYFIMKNFDNPDLCAETIAKQCGISANHLRTTFKTEFNMTPHQFLVTLRMKEAIRLLMNSTKTIEQISEACGYIDPTNFTRAFKQYAKMSPSEYRKSKKQKL